MDFQKLTLKSQEAVAGAQELARRAGNPELTPDHLTSRCSTRSSRARSSTAPATGRASFAQRPKRGSRSCRP